MIKKILNITLLTLSLYNACTYCMIIKQKKEIKCYSCKNCLTENFKCFEGCQKCNEGTKKCKAGCFDYLKGFRKCFAVFFDFADSCYLVLQGCEEVGAKEIR